MDVELVYARWKLGGFPSEELPAFAGDLMVAGWEGRAVINLVSFHRPTTYEVGDAFDQVLIELGIAVPDRKRCALLLAQEVARDVVLGCKTACSGAYEICRWMGWSGFCYQEEGPSRCRCVEIVYRILDYDGS